jgi:hypothetical protein
VAAGVRRAGGLPKKMGKKNHPAKEFSGKGEEEEGMIKRVGTQP